MTGLARGVGRYVVDVGLAAGDDVVMAAQTVAGDAGMAELHLGPVNGAAVAVFAHIGRGQMLRVFAVDVEIAAVVTAVTTGGNVGVTEVDQRPVAGALVTVFTRLLRGQMLRPLQRHAAVAYVVAAFAIAHHAGVIVVDAQPVGDTQMAGLAGQTGAGDMGLALTGGA